MPRRAPAGAAKIVRPKTVRREPPPGSVLIPGIYARLTEMARERLAHGDPDPRCTLDGSDDPGRHDADRRGNVATRAELAALLAGQDVTVTFWQVMDATEGNVMPLFPRGIARFLVGSDGYVWPEVQRGTR